MVYTEWDKKIWNYDSPEALAKALETKNQELANKIREFWKNQITWESQDWRERLKQELTAAEEKSIRDAIDESQVDNFFNEWMSGEEKTSLKATQQIEQLAPWAAPILAKAGKMQSFFDNISSSWNKAGSLFEQWKFLEAIKVFILWIFWKSIDEDQVSQDKQTSTQNWWVETSKNIWYQASLKVILWFTPEKDEKTFDILNLPQISWKNFSTLKWLKEESIMQELGISGTSIHNKDVFTATQVLIKKETQIDELIWKQHPNWRSQYSIIEICTILWPTMKPIESFQKFDYKNIANSNIQFWEFKIWEPSDLGEKFEQLKTQRWSIFEWVSKDLISQILLSGNTDESNTDLLLNKYTSEQDKNFIKKFAEFKHMMIWSIQTDFFLWKKEERDNFENHFSKLTPKQSLELMILTGGKTNKSEMNSVEQTAVYLKIWSIMWIGPLRWKTYDYALLQWSLQEWSEFSEQIPQPLKDTIKTIAKNSLESSISVLWKTIKELFWMLSTEQKIWVWIASWVVLAWLWYMGPLRHAMGGVIVMWLWWGLAMIASQAYANDPTKFKEQFGNTSPEDIAKQSEKEIANAFKM